jgi:hypothetical protein
MKSALKFTAAAFSEKEHAREIVRREFKSATQEVAQLASNVLEDAVRKIRLDHPEVNGFQAFTRAVQANPHSAQIVFRVFSKGAVSADYMRDDINVEVEG